MAGHSKWATTHRQKSLVDAKRGAIFTKYSNLITIAAKKGGDPETNSSLRSAIERAKSVSMPKDNIERAIKKGTGELAGDQVEEIYYEAIMPPNIHFVVKCVTDNKNRSSASVRHIFAKNNGSFSSVLWNFDQKAVVKVGIETIKEQKINLEKLELDLIDLEIDDFLKEDEGIIIQAEIESLQEIKDFLENKNLVVESAEIEYVAKDKIDPSQDDLDKLERIYEELEDNEDVSDYYTNLS